MKPVKNTKDDIFAELAKAKSQPMPLKIKSEELSLNEENESEGQLTVDVFQNPDEIVVQSTVAGVSPDDLEIHITNESVTIRGKRERAEKIEEKDYFYQECFWGSFSRSIILPTEVDSEKSTAVLKNGVLTIKMPKLDRSKTKKLKVKID
ncbi:MAG: Hsp20/alpha crystallin family protein [Patescibacteria group bacterium]